MRCKRSRYRRGLMRYCKLCKGMYYLEFKGFIIWSEVYCALVVRFRPASRVVHQIFRERTKAWL